MRLIAAICAVVLAAAAFVAGPGEALAGSKGKRVMHLTGPIQNPFINELARAFTETAKKHGMSVTVQGSPFDAALQAQQVNDAIAQKYDLIALVAMSEHGAIPPLLRAKRAGVPVVLVNSPVAPGHDELYVTFVGEEHSVLGQLTGRSLAKALPNGGKVALVTGALAEGVAPLRVAGFKAEIAKHPNIKIVAIEDAKWSTTLSERVAGQLFARYAARGGLDAIYAMADNQAAAVVKAAEAAGIPLGLGKGKLVVVSSNCMKPGIDYIKAGKMYSTATQMPSRTGRVSAEVIAAYFNGETMKKKNILKMELITRDNVARFEKPCTF
jgi:ribose transport system substrate-binding protein